MAFTVTKDTVIGEVLDYDSSLAEACTVSADQAPAAKLLKKPLWSTVWIGHLLLLG